MASAMKNDAELSREGDEQSEAGTEISHGNDSAAGPCKSVERQGTSSAMIAAAVAPSFNDSIDADSARGSPAKETEEEAKIRHIMANRKSAKESRERRKQKMAQLSADADALTAANRSLRSVNFELRGGVQDLKQQLRQKMAVLQQQNGVMAQETLRAHSFLGGSIRMPDILRPPGQHNFSPHQAMAISSPTSEAAKIKDGILLPSAQGFEAFAADAIADLKHAPSPSNVAARQGTSASAQTSSDNDSVDPEPAVPAKKEETEEEKRMRRVMANRKSAKESRIRRRAKIAKLSAEIDLLTASNRSLRTTNSELTAGVRDMKEQLRLALAVAQQHQGRMLTREVVNASFSNIAPDDYMQGHRPPARQQGRPNFSQTSLLREAVNEDFDSVLGGPLMDDLEE